MHYKPNKYFFEIQPNVVLATHSPIPTVAAYITNRKLLVLPIQNMLR